GLAEDGAVGADEAQAHAVVTLDVAQGVPDQADVGRLARAELGPPEVGRGDLKVVVQLGVVARGDALQLPLPHAGLAASELDFGQAGLGAGWAAAGTDQAERAAVLEHAQRQAVAPGRRLGWD